MTDEQLKEWRAHPTTEYLLSAMRNHLESVKADMKEQFWAGDIIAPVRYATAQAYEQLFESLSEGSAEDFAGLSDE